MAFLYLQPANRNSQHATCIPQRDQISPAAAMMSETLLVAGIFCNDYIS